MRRESRAVIVALLSMLAACQGGMTADAAEPNAASVIRGKQSNDPDAGATLCKADEEVLISCRLEGSKQIASMCISRSSNGKPRTTRFVQAVPGETPVLQHDPDDGDSASVIHWTHLWRAGPTGAYVYSFEHGGRRYGFHSEEGTYHASAGLFESQPASQVAISDTACDMETLVEHADPDLARLVRTWPRDEQIDEDDLPLTDEKGRMPIANDHPAPDRAR